MKHCLYKEIHDPFDDEGGPVDWQREKVAKRILGLDSKEEPPQKEEQHGSTNCLNRIPGVRPSNTRK